MKINSPRIADQGYLQCDGYAIYDNVDNIIPVGCWAHARRKYNDALNQWNKLNRYIAYGELGIDNNITERDIRAFTTGRKNWTFSQSVNGSEAERYFIVLS